MFLNELKAVSINMPRITTPLWDAVYSSGKLNKYCLFKMVDDYNM